MTDRRTFIKGMAGLLPIGALSQVHEAHGIEHFIQSSRRAVERDYFKELGVKSFINAAAPYSSLSGAQMWPEVIEAMDYGMRNKAKMKELHDAVGKRIASLCGSEAAMVSAGATSAMTLGTAACMTGSNQDLIRLLPDTTGMKNEVIIQKGHRYSYEHAIRNCGAKMVEVETVEDLKKAINRNTVMMLFYYAREDRAKIRAKEFVSLGNKYNIPTFCDGATTIPPVDPIYKMVKLGFDLICFSGGKGLRGPYSAGLLLGRKDQIEAARLNGAPNDDTIGRGMKVSKEEILGMMVALETSIESDFKMDVKKGRKWVEYIGQRVGSLPGVETELFTPKSEGHQPHLRVVWDESKIKISPAEAKKQLREGDPSIEICALSLTGGRFELSAWMMEEGEAEIVAERIQEILNIV